MQYFRFDEQGNMFVYEGGAGFSGECHLVSPGDEMIFNRKSTFYNVNESGDRLNERESVDVSQVVCDGDVQDMKTEVKPGTKR